MSRSRPERHTSHGCATRGNRVSNSSKSTLRARLSQPESASTGGPFASGPAIMRSGILSVLMPTTTSSSRGCEKSRCCKPGLSCLEPTLNSRKTSSGHRKSRLGCRNPSLGCDYPRRSQNTSVEFCSRHGNQFEERSSSPRPSPPRRRRIVRRFTESRATEFA